MGVMNTLLDTPLLMVSSEIKNKAIIEAGLANHGPMVALLAKCFARDLHSMTKRQLALSPGFLSSGLSLEALFGAFEARLFEQSQNEPQSKEDKLASTPIWTPGWSSQSLGAQLKVGAPDISQLLNLKLRIQ